MISRRFLTLVALGLALAAWSRPVLADGADPLAQRVNIELRDADCRDFFQSVAKLTKGEVMVDPALSGPLTLTVNNVSVRTVLNAACESLGCRWTMEGGKRLKIHAAPLPPEAPPALSDEIDLKLTKAAGLDVLRTFAQILTAELAAPDLAGAVTMDLESVPVGEGLDEVCRQLGCSWELIEKPKRVLRVLKTTADRR